MFFWIQDRSVKKNGTDGKLGDAGNWGKQW